MVFFHGKPLCDVGKVGKVFARKGGKKENWQVGTQQTVSSAFSIHLYYEEGLKFTHQN